MTASCNVRMKNITQFDEELYAAGIFGPTYLQIQDASPTNSAPLSLSVGASLVPYAQYCLKENDTSNVGCSWFPGNVPTVYATSETNGPVTLSL